MARIRRAVGGSADSDRGRAAPVAVIVADPPWSFGDLLPGKGRGAEKHYQVLGLDKIQTFLTDQEIRVADDALLFMWRVSSQVEEANSVVRAWGFTSKSEIVWVKTAGEVAQREYLAGRMPGLAFGMGRYVRLCHESCIVATRGKGLRLIADHAVRSVFFAERREHSKKPEEFFDLVERLVGDAGPKLELFARRHRSGWTCMGNEVDGKVGT